MEELWLTCGFIWRKWSYATGGGAREVISDLSESLVSRYFVADVNERTSFALCVSAFKSAGLD